jgi:hypothetical protein
MLRTLTICVAGALSIASAHAKSPNPMIAPPGWNCIYLADGDDEAECDLVPGWNYENDYVYNTLIATRYDAPPLIRNADIDTPRAWPYLTRDEAIAIHLSQATIYDFLTFHRDRSCDIPEESIYCRDTWERKK